MRLFTSNWSLFNRRPAKLATLASSAAATLKLLHSVAHRRLDEIQLSLPVFKEANCLWIFRLAVATRSGKDFRAEGSHRSLAAL